MPKIRPVIALLLLSLRLWADDASSARDLPPGDATAAGTQAPRNRVVLLPVTDLTDHRDFLYLKGTIYNVLLINLKRQERIELLNEGPQAGVIDQSVPFETSLAALAGAFPGAVAVAGEYYAAGDKCHILVNVWDLDTLRIKNSFLETMPADLDLLPNIEKMSERIAFSVARALPPTERDALFQKQVVTSLRRKINEEEQTAAEIASFRQALSVVPGTGLGLARTVIAWTPAGPFISPVLSIDYAYFFESALHLRFRVEYLGLANLYGGSGVQREFSLEALVGLHTSGSFSFSFEAGLAASWDWNDESAAVATTATDDEPEPRSVERFSLTLPLAVGFTLSFTPRWFVNLSLTYNGLTCTFEPLAPADGDWGYEHLRYAYGFSPWNFINITLSLKAGVRF